MHRTVNETIKSFLERNLDELAVMEIQRELNLDVNFIREHIIPLIRDAHVEANDERIFKDAYEYAWEDFQQRSFNDNDAHEAYREWLKDRK